MKLKSTQIIAIAAVIIVVAAGIAVFALRDNDSDKEKTHEVTDMQGNVCVVPNDPKNVVITSQSPMVPVYIYYKNGVDTLAGANAAGLTYAKNGVLGKIYDLTGIPTDFVKGSDVNEESLLKLNPDLVIYTGNRTAEHDMLEKNNLANVGFNTAMTGGNATDPFEALECWLKLLKDICGDNGRADKLIDYNNAAKASVKAKIDTVADSDKPKVMIIFAINTDGTVKVAGSGHYSEYWINAAGGKNVAKDLTGLKDVSMEQIYTWNPDYIFFANSTGKMPTNIINNDITGQDWSTVQAAQDGHVYVFPAATYFSYAPSLEAGVTLQFLAKILHPTLFSTVDMDKVASDFFKEMFDYTATSEMIAKFLYPDPTSVVIH
jgi:iron complex transport system substrate-binding protein